MKEMRYTTVLILIVFGSCSVGQPTAEEKRFAQSLKDVRRLSLPTTFNSNTLLLESKQLLDKKRFNQDSLTINPYGICLETDKYYGIIFRASADIFYPNFVTIDKSGHRIDSLLLVDKNEDEPSWRVREHATIARDRTIVLIDSAESWKTDEDYNRISGTHKIEEVKISRYRISDSGKIEIQKE